MRKFLNSGDVAKLFDVTPETVRQWEKAGKLVAFRSPGGRRRFPRDEVERLMREAGIEPEPVAEPETAA